MGRWTGRLAFGHPGATSPGRRLETGQVEIPSQSHNSAVGAGSLAGLAEVADQVVCVAVPRRFVAVGRHYLDFGQVDDIEVRELLGG